MDISKRTIFILAIIFLAAASRLVEHPFNFTPVVAMSIFSGCYMSRRWGMLIPLGAMLLSDMALYSSKYGWEMFDWKIAVSVYASIGFAYLLGNSLKKHRSWYSIGSAALLASVIFFLITNFAVWAFYDWYPHTLQGLTNCFLLAIPFFRNSLAGDLVYTGALFGVYEVAVIYSQKFVAQRQTQE